MSKRCRPLRMESTNGNGRVRRPVTLATVAALALHVVSSQDIVATWDFGIISQNLPVLPPNASEVSLRILRTLASPLELWIWPQAFATLANGNALNSGFNVCSFMPQTLGRSWLVYTLDDAGVPAEAAWRPSINAPSAYFTPRSAVYDPVRDVIMAFSPAVYMTFDECRALNDPNIDCFACHKLYLTYDEGCMVWTKDTYVFNITTATWMRYSPAETGADTPLSSPSVRPQGDGAFTPGLVHVYDAFTGLIVTTAGYQTDGSFPVVNFAPVWTFNISSVQWTRLNVSWTPVEGDVYPNSGPSSIISETVAVMSPVRHELVMFGGTDVSRQLVGGYCYRLDLDRYAWIQQLSCDFDADVSPFLWHGASFALGSTAATYDGLYMFGGWLGDPYLLWVRRPRTVSLHGAVHADLHVQVEVSTATWMLNLTTYTWVQLINDTPVQRNETRVDDAFPYTLFRASAYAVPHSDPSVQRIVVFGGVMLNASVPSLYFDLRKIEACARYEGGFYAFAGRYVTMPDVVHVVTLRPQTLSCVLQRVNASLAGSVFAVLLGLSTLCYMLVLRAEQERPLMHTMLYCLDAVCTCSTAAAMPALAALTSCGTAPVAYSLACCALLCTRYVFTASTSACSADRWMLGTWCCSRRAAPSNDWRLQQSIATYRVRPTVSCTAWMINRVRVSAHVVAMLLTSLLFVAAGSLAKDADTEVDVDPSPEPALLVGDNGGPQSTSRQYRSLCAPCTRNRNRRTWVMALGNGSFGVPALVLIITDASPQTTSSFTGFSLAASLSMLLIAAVVSVDRLCAAAKVNSQRNARKRYEHFLASLLSHADGTERSAEGNLLHINFISSEDAHDG